jgi:hypothetical protein
LSGIDYRFAPHFSGTVAVSLILATAVLVGFRRATDPGDHRSRSPGAVALGSGVVRRSFGVLAPVLGTASFGFGVSYVTAASMGAQQVDGGM